MKKQLVKSNYTTKIYLIIIVLLFIALVVTFYFGFIKDTEQPIQEEKQLEEIVVGDPSKNVPTSDLVTLFYESGNRLFYAYIEDGLLYYFNDTDVMAFMTPFSKIQKYTGLSNITRMKTYNLGTGVNPVPFLITEEGQVYYIDYYVDNDIKVELFEDLAGYEVADILSHSGEMSSVFELLLKDGTIQTVKCENY